MPRRKKDETIDAARLGFLCAKYFLGDPRSDGFFFLQGAIGRKFEWDELKSLLRRIMRSKAADSVVMIHSDDPEKLREALDSSSLTLPSGWRLVDADEEKRSVTFRVTWPSKTVDIAAVKNILKTWEAS